ncbi:hypothetical protein GCM10023221_13810 [Luteimicrobium xylanilyticum]|uniref:DNA-directed DNA polymerase n=1 Tax=Luteimicrobium xylanilyticum TaxID=1133546 RepID=A0A5P9QCN6_9MICO|nr:exonuclease domain-containing protein [Luteimicrobium xylanilyticum]QFU99147.1 DNA-directed DNA polymerase [Luteimicrobium xylanilyticum]
MTLAPTGPLPAAVARTYSHRYAVVDVETSGLSAAHDRVLQIAVVLLGPDGAHEGEWSTLLDPGCDPGRTDIHGLTRERLSGAPRFPDVLPILAPLLADRVLVAHNARFDWDFLAHEANRAGATLPVAERLCTLALARRLDLPAANLSLAALARYWRVPQTRAHDAVDDTRVLVEVLRHSLVVAHRVGAPLPLTRCEVPRATRPAPAPRTPCAWRDPGRLEPGRPLRQGLKVVFTGETTRPREVLIHEATAAGLDVMNSVSSRTGLVVCNSTTLATGKAAAARRHGTLVVAEDEFLRLLGHVQPGEPKQSGGTSVGTAVPASEVPHERPAPPPTTHVVAPAPPEARSGAATTSAPPSAPTGPLAGSRVLVVGGSYEEACSARARIVELGGRAAVNLTAAVTHVVALEWPEQDSRWPRIARLAMPRLDPVTFVPVDVAGASATTGAPVDPTATVTAVAPDVPVLPRGGVRDLPDGEAWSLSVRWPDDRFDGEIDVVALVVDADEQVGGDEDFCFYHQPAHPSGGVALELDHPCEALVELRPSLLPAGRRVLVAASIDGEGVFGDVGPLELVLRTGSGEPVLRATLDAAASERTLVLANVYARSGTWRFRAVGQGYGSGLDALAVLHGVDLED